MKLKAHVSRENDLENNIFQLFKLIWAQLTEALQNRIMREIYFKAKKAASDVVWLLTTIKKLVVNMNHTNNSYKSAVICLTALVAPKQGKSETVGNYRYEGVMDTVRILGFKEIFRDIEFANAHSNGNLDKCAEAIFPCAFSLERTRIGMVLYSVRSIPILY